MVDLMSSCFWLENWTVQKGFESMLPGTGFFDVFCILARSLRNGSEACGLLGQM